MTIKQRHYTSEAGFTADYLAVKAFLKRIYKDDFGSPQSWIWNRWEWMFSLPYLDETMLNRIGIWEDEGQIIGLATYEQGLGDVWLSLDPDYPELKEAMIEYATVHLAAIDEKGERSLRLCILETDDAFSKYAAGHGFVPDGDNEATAIYRITDPLPPVILPEGFSIVSLAEENDLMKLHRVLWKGFNHAGEPPVESLHERERMQSGQEFDQSLALAVKSPEGDFVSFCNLWHDPETDYAIVEPMATVPEYRKMGLGRALLVEGFRRCAARGAEKVYVGSEQVFYYKVGFEPLINHLWWQKKWKEV